MKRLIKGWAALWLAVALLAAPAAPALAGDPGKDPAGDAKIKKLWSDLATLHKAGPKSQYAEMFMAKYDLTENKMAKLFADKPRMGKAGASEGKGMSPEAAKLVCGVEFTLGVGARIWRNRREYDAKCYKQSIPRGDLAYCVDYSVRCNHYAWCKGCYFSNECGGPCPK